MPTYQYACTACDERLEAVQSFADPALVECPACSGRLRKVFSAVGVVFKGSGFYKNDSRDAAKKSSKSDSASSGSSTEGSSSSNGDASSSSTPKATGNGSGGDSGSTGAGKSTPAATPAAKAPASTAGKSS